MRQYRSKKWKAFRLEMIAINEHRCARCEKAQFEGAVLQIHHREYDASRAIWDYLPDEVEVVCKGCHAEIHGKIKPKTGWVCVAEDDLGDLSGECDHCGTNLRYVFLVMHENWEPMEVGTYCCDELTGDRVASDRRKYLEKRTRFCSSTRWISQHGRHFISQKGVDATITNKGEKYIINILGAKGKEEFDTLNLAKAALFDKIESGKIHNWINSKQACR